MEMGKGKEKRKKKRDSRLNGPGVILAQRGRASAQRREQTSPAGHE
jgi:hypothetical protein